MKRFSFISALLIYSLMPVMAHAEVTDTLNNFFSYLTGGVGKTVAALAIVGIGFGCFSLGKIPKSYVISVVTGVGVLFGSKTILSMLTG